MNKALRPHRQAEAQIVDFDLALLDACPADVRAELLAEARLLAQAFAPEGQEQELETMADALTAGARDDDMARPRARKLAAALRCLARRAA